MLIVSTATEKNIHQITFEEGDSKTFNVIKLHFVKRKIRISSCKQHDFIDEHFIFVSATASKLIRSWLFSFNLNFHE